MKTYVGTRGECGTVVLVDNGEGVSYALRPRLDLRNHSPTGFDWGYGGSGPAQLALAILADHLGDDAVALDLYQDFKGRMVAAFPYVAFSLTSDQVYRVVEKLLEESGALYSYDRLQSEQAGKDGAA